MSTQIDNLDQYDEAAGCSLSQANCSALAARIPFNAVMHMIADNWHLGLYTNERLGIVYRYHHPAKDGYVKTGPGVKVKKWVYRESPKNSPQYPTLSELIAADDELRERAEAAYSPNDKLSNTSPKNEDE